MTKIQYRVRPVTRYNLTRYESGENSGSCGSVAEFDNWEEANKVAKALAAVTDGASYVQEPTPELVATMPVNIEARLISAEQQLREHVAMERYYSGIRQNNGGGSAC